MFLLQHKQQKHLLRERGGGAVCQRWVGREISFTRQRLGAPRFAASAIMFLSKASSAVDRHSKRSRASSLLQLAIAAICVFQVIFFTSSLLSLQVLAGP